MTRSPVLAACAFLLLSRPAPGMAQAADPLAGYYGNTLICLTPAAAPDQPAEELHLWLQPDGRFIRFGGAWGPQQGTYRQDATRVCLHAATPGLSLAGAFARDAPPAAPPSRPDCLALAPHTPGDRWQQPDEDAAGVTQSLQLVAGQR